MTEGALETAIALAIEKHAGQTDKSGAPFIGHPIRVMASLRPDELMMKIGVLHDIVEDTDVTHEQVKEMFGVWVWFPVWLLTKEKGLTYREYIESLKANELARLVKLADLRDNMRPERITTSETQGLQKRYRWAVKYLKEVGR